VILGREGLCWGDHFFGQLGDGTTVDRLTPVPVGKALPWTQVTAGTVHSCGLTSERHVYCWGENNIGQVGVIPRGQYLLPVRVLGPM
jgi:alpha-tubulin suppressor-like RCC1 family protein